MIKVNLLGDRHAKEKIIIQQQLVVGIFILLGTFVVLGMWWDAKSDEIQGTNLKIGEAKKELTNQKKVREKVKGMEAREHRLNAILKSIEMLVAEKHGPTPYFDNLNVILPPEIWLTTMSDNGGNIGVEGFAFSNTAVAKLMKNMERSKHFHRVELSEITTTKVKKETLKKFKVTSMTTMAVKKEAEKKKKEAEAAKKKKKRR